MARTAEEEATFLKYFLNTYIPPFTYAIPVDAESFEYTYLSVATIWDNFGPALHTYSFANQLKKELIHFFELASEAWIRYLCVPDNGYKAWAVSAEAKQHWSGLQAQAKVIYRISKSRKYI